VDGLEYSSDIIFFLLVGVLVAELDSKQGIRGLWDCGDGTIFSDRGDIYDNECIDGIDDGLHGVSLGGDMEIGILSIFNEHFDNFVLPHDSPNVVCEYFGRWRCVH